MFSVDLTVLALNEAWVRIYNVKTAVRGIRRDLSDAGSVELLGAGTAQV